MATVLVEDLHHFEKLNHRDIEPYPREADYPKDTCVWHRPHYVYEECITKDIMLDHLLAISYLLLSIGVIEG